MIGDVVNFHICEGVPSPTSCEGADLPSAKFQNSSLSPDKVSPDKVYSNDKKLKLYDAIVSQNTIRKIDIS